MSNGSSQGGFQDLIGKALVDKDFRDKLFTDRPEAVKGFTLSPDEQQALAGLTKEQFEEQAAKITAGQQAMMVMMPTPTEPPDPTEPEPEPDPKPKP